MSDDGNEAMLEWLDAIWPEGRRSQPAQEDENPMLGPALLQKWAAYYISLESVSVAIDSEVPLPQAADTSVWVMTSKEQLEAVKDIQLDAFRLPEDNQINGFAVALAMDKKWKITWPDDGSGEVQGGGSRARKPASSGLVEFSTHDSYEVESFRQDSATSKTCELASTVALASAVMISVLFKTVQEPDPEDEESDQDPKINNKGKFEVEEIRVDAFFMAPNGFAAVTVSLVSPLLRACLPWCQLTRSDPFLLLSAHSLCTSARASQHRFQNSNCNQNSIVSPPAKFFGVRN